MIVVTRKFYKDGYMTSEMRAFANTDVNVIDEYCSKGGDYTFQKI